jgi:hypothetical protein
MAVLTVRDERLREVEEFARIVERSREDIVDEAIDNYLRDKATAVTQKRKEAFDRLMNFPRVKVPADFDYKKELAEARDERFNRIS